MKKRAKSDNQCALATPLASSPLSTDIHLATHAKKSINTLSSVNAQIPLATNVQSDAISAFSTSFTPSSSFTSSTATASSLSITPSLSISPHLASTLSHAALLTYKDSGVNIDEGNDLVRALKPLVQSTFTPHVLGGIGSFAGAFALPSGYAEPVLLAATDGVGTKLRLAIDADRLNTVGIDLVAMCVNDLLCNFATPLFFLDYYATGKLDKHAALAVIQGIVEGCKQAGCALIGGESAEMPGMYHGKDFDIAGFAVGIAERADVERTYTHSASHKRCVKEGDILIGLASSGLHANGFSLARKVLFEHLHLDISHTLANGTNLLDTLLAPTYIYTAMFKRHHKQILALAHITGGGIVENLPRVLPEGLGAIIRTSSIPRQEIFTLLQAHITQEEAYRVFNMGVGMILVVDSHDVTSILAKTKGFVLGEVVHNEGIRIC